jgi:GMP synthase (glutamine-hydrolysing)
MDMIIVLDFGGQYCHLTARRIRDLGVYSEILPYDVDLSRIKEYNPKGIILSGGPSSVYEKGEPKLKKDFYDYIKSKRIPLLGICYGHHLIVYQLGGKIRSHKNKEYGKTIMYKREDDDLLKGLNDEEVVWMSHGDQVEELPKGFKILAETNSCPIAAYANKQENIYGVQFHPEVTNTAKGNIILSNFLIPILFCILRFYIKNY